MKHVLEYTVHVSDLAAETNLSFLQASLTLAHAFLLPFSSYHEWQTFYRIVTRLKHSSLSSQTGQILSC